MSNCIGIDVSKATINIHISKTNQDLVLDNNLKSFRSLFSKLKKIYKKEIEINDNRLNVILSLPDKKNRKHTA